MSFKSNQRPLWNEIIGNPEGQRIGTPGDMVYARDTGILWVKAFGRQTKEGWRQLATIPGGAAIGGQGDNINLFTTGLGPTGQTGQVRLSTQVDSRDTSRRFGTFDAQNVVVPAGGITALAVLDQLSVDGRNSKIRLDATGVDASDFSSVVATTAGFVFRRSGGSMAIVTAFPDVSEFVQTGPANTFGQEVILSVSAIPPDIVFFAQNISGVPLTGHVTATWWVQQGGLRV